MAILDLDAGLYYSLDKVVARIWELVQEPRVVEEIQAIVLEEYEVDSARGKQDVLALLQELVDKGLAEAKGNMPRRACVRSCACLLLSSGYCSKSQSCWWYPE